MAEKKTTEQENQQKNPLMLVIIGLFSLIALFATARFLIPQALVYLTQAAKPGKYSLSNSYVFGAPLSAPADGQTKIRVSAFLLNDEGRGVAEKQVSLNITPKEGAGGTPQVNQVQPTTDQFGKAVFEVVSSSPGQYLATAVVDGMEIPQTVTLTFR